MKITNVETVRLGEFPNIIWVRIHTDEGLTGLGETFMGAAAVEAYIHEWVGPKLIGKLKNSDISVLLVEHNMALVMDISDRVVVLDYGKKIGDGVPDEVRSNEAVVAAYLGVSH